MIEERNESVPQTQPLAAASDARHWRDVIGRLLFRVTILLSLLALLTLLATVVNRSAGLVAWTYEVDPATLADRPLETLEKDALIGILKKELSSGLLRRLDQERPLAERSRGELHHILKERVLKAEAVSAWPLSDSLLQREAIEAEVAETHPEADLRFHLWLNRQFLVRPMSSHPALAGIRSALLGSLWMIGLTILFAAPLGIGAAIYLEEYAEDTRLNRLLQANINNLAGVPSIVYGMLGLAIFVRALEPLTSGALLGMAGANGRTILSASLTMALLILPILIISTQEAIRAVPGSIRMASYALGATKWQTIRHHVLPAALPGILTGNILAVARALGETAPLIVVGASTFILADPGGPFSQFTALPIQIYNWSTRPQETFQLTAAAAILVLLVLLLALNAAAILLRNRLAARYKL